MKRMVHVFVLGHVPMDKLNVVCKRSALTQRESSALRNLQSFAATRSDLQALSHLAKCAGLSWDELFPEWLAADE